MIELRECPFCGNDVCIAAPISTFMTHRVICPACDCGGPECFGADEAIASWNRRASDLYTVTPTGRAMLKDGE